MSIFKKTMYKTVLGIAYDHNSLTLSLLSANGSGVKVQQSVRVNMSLDLLSGEPELVGQEIRNHLQQAGIHETRCVLSVPVQWVMSKSLEVPELSADDEKNYITLHSEREFPYPASDLSIFVSRYTNPADTDSVLISAIPLRQIEKMKSIFQAAKLQLVSITVGVGQFHFDRPVVQLILQRREQGTDCFILSQNHIISARYINHTNNDDDETILLMSDLKRELRITLGQLPSGIRNAITSVALYGPELWCRDIETIVPTLPGCGSVQITNEKLEQQNGLILSQPYSHEHAASIGSAFAFLIHQKSNLEYLPPHISRIEQIFKQVSSKRNLVVGQVAAVLVFFLIAVFGYQHWAYTNLSSQWTSIEDQVTEVDAIQQKVKQFRPWFHKNITSLTVLKTLSELFPEEGSIWVKTVQIENETQITLSGFANNNQVLTSTMDMLRASESIDALQLQQVTGKSPVQYSLQFNWIGG